MIQWQLIVSIGGNYVMGNYLLNAFRWSETVGPWEERPGHFNDVWGYWTDDGLGFFEFLQDVVDSIEFARGDPGTSWASVRAAMGHPEPFQLNYISMGNEECSMHYYKEQQQSMNLNEPLTYNLLMDCKTTYGFNSCIMDHAPLIMPRLVIGFGRIASVDFPPFALWRRRRSKRPCFFFKFRLKRLDNCFAFACRAVIQLLCSYSTLPLYAIVTQMGTFYKKEIFDEHVQQGLLGWVQKARMRTELFKDAAATAAGPARHGPSSRLEMLRRAAALMQCRGAPPR
ncbi:arabinoxylan arabinofuranohydrolase [Hordeum vulgare]|nr:arabinoxylan arabinofuranohydrolase [Hordeum vulgare]